MKAIILAAGVGKRIGAVTGIAPSACSNSAVDPCWFRYLDALLTVGVKRRRSSSWGNRQELIRDAVGRVIAAWRFGMWSTISTTGAVSNFAVACSRELRR